MAELQALSRDYDLQIVQFDRTYREFDVDLVIRVAGTARVINQEKKIEQVLKLEKH